MINWLPFFPEKKDRPELNSLELDCLNLDCFFCIVNGTKIDDETKDKRIKYQRKKESFSQ